jgi:3-hydroxyacyl-[acyl-carrier-protein] dehydratase
MLAIDPDLPQADILAIKRMIPHRYPFLMIDRVVNIAVNKSAVGIKNVSVNEPYFDGHFPVRPVMPGVLIIEAMAQTSAVLVVETLDLVDKNLLVYFMGIDEAKFRHVVQPGDRLDLQVDALRGRSMVWKFRGEARVGDTLCAEAIFAAMIMTPEEAGAKG